MALHVVRRHVTGAATMKRASRKSYSERDLAEAHAWIENHRANFDENVDICIVIAELIARVRRRGERVIKQLRDERARNHESNFE
jgi:hypothetical protein